MKKKLFLMVVMTFVFALALTFAVSAEAIHNSSTVDYDATVTLDDGTVLPLYDENNEALIWYISGTKEDGTKAYSSIRADDSQVLWNTKSWGEVTGVSIALTDGTKYAVNQFVVVNMMDDDVKSNYGEGGHTNLGKAITSFKWIFNGANNLEYAYLRLDTDGIYQIGFQGCSKLKYINLENLTKLARIGNNGVFNGCASLFKGQVLDLSKTKLEKIDDGSEIFKDVPIKGIILPETFWRFSASNTFKNCTLLETVVLTKKISQVGDYIFNGCTSLKAIFYIGTEEELDAFIEKANILDENNESKNKEITEATKISYVKYKALSEAEKASKTYIVYNYSWCDAYNKGVHEETTTLNECVEICDVCSDYIVNHIDGNTSTTISYSSYDATGIKVVTCNNDYCAFQEESETPALFICLGYSIPDDGRDGLVISFTLNQGAIDEYTALTGKTFKFGAFAAAESKIGNEDVVTADGQVAENTISADITDYNVAAFDLVVLGFSEEYRDLGMAMGAYVIDGDTVSYMQAGKPEGDSKYYFASYNDVKAL